VLAGTLNEEGRALRRRAAPLGASIHFPGYIPDDSLSALDAGASLFVYPSRAEGFGIPPLLAMASGVPVVAADTPAVVETLGGAGIVVPVDDAPALAAFLRGALRDPSSLDPSRDRGRARAASFTVDAMASRIRAAYERAASRPEGST